MTLIKSISGIRGTIGGKVGDGLSPIDVVKFTSAFGYWIKQRNRGVRCRIVIGRDARMSGQMVSKLVTATLQGLGIDVVDLGLSTTPTVEVMVPECKAQAGIILTASHNPRQWNALKLLNEKGEFISGAEGAEVLQIAEDGAFEYVEVDHLGTYQALQDSMQVHIKQILALDLVDVEAIRERNFKVAFDAVNSTGGIFIPELLYQLGVKEVLPLYAEPTGDFPHNPEPLPEHLTEISNVIKQQQADVGFVVDPDVDRLAIVNEDGSMFGEEYTLVAVADYVLAHKKGDTVSNMSSTRAFRDVSEKHGVSHHASAVGEVNVVDKMKEVNAVIGGEGNGGIIYPELHYGRDALVGIALFLTLLAKKDMSCSALRKTYPEYVISKNKIQLTPEINVDEVLEAMKEKYSQYPVNTVDGVKIEFENEWVHLRKSNTEPIIRIYAESKTKADADKLAEDMIGHIREVL